MPHVPRQRQFAAYCALRNKARLTGGIMWCELLSDKSDNRGRPGMTRDFRFSANLISLKLRFWRSGDGDQYNFFTFSYAFSRSEILSYIKFPNANFRFKALVILFAFSAYFSVSNTSSSCETPLP